MEKDMKKISEVLESFVFFFFLPPTASKKGVFLLYILSFDKI